MPDMVDLFFAGLKRMGSAIRACCRSRGGASPSVEDMANGPFGRGSEPTFHTSLLISPDDQRRREAWAADAIAKLKKHEYWGNTQFCRRRINRTVRLATGACTYTFFGSKKRAFITTVSAGVVFLAARYAGGGAAASHVIDASIDDVIPEDNKVSVISPNGMGLAFPQLDTSAMSHAITSISFACIHGLCDVGGVNFVAVVDGGGMRLDLTTAIKTVSDLSRAWFVNMATSPTSTSDTVGELTVNGQSRRFPLWNLGSTDVCGISLSSSVYSLTAGTGPGTFWFEGQNFPQLYQLTTTLASQANFKFNFKFIGANVVGGCESGVVECEVIEGGHALLLGTFEFVQANMRILLRSTASVMSMDVDLTSALGCVPPGDKLGNVVLLPPDSSASTVTVEEVDEVVADAPPTSLRHGS
jgi:hypothetical protein